MKTLYGPLKAEASGPEASPELPGKSSHGVAQAQASIRGGAFPVLSFPPHHARCKTDDSHLFSHPPHPVALRRLGGASRGSGEPGGAHAGILPGESGFGHSQQE